MDEPNSSGSEARLLAVLADPDNWGLQITELCARAGIGRAFYYRIYSRPDFVARRSKVLNDAMGSETPRVKKVLLQSAMILGRDGDAARKLLFEMTGDYIPNNKQTLELKGPPLLEGDMTDEELVWRYLKANWPRDQWIKGVRQRYELGQITPRQPAALAGTVTL